MTAAPVLESRRTGGGSPALKIVLLLLTLFVPLQSLFSESRVPLSTRMLAAALWVLCMLPSWRYLTQPPHRRRPVPFLPVIGLLYGLYYAVPAMLSLHQPHLRIYVDPERDYVYPLTLALLGWLCLLFGTQLSGGVRPIRKQLIPSVEDIPQTRLLALSLGGLGLDLLRQLSTVPVSVAQIVIFLVTVGHLGTCLLIILNLRGRLGVTTRWLLYSVIGMNFVVQVATGLVSNLAFYLAFLLLSVWIERKRLHASLYVVILVGFALIFSLRSVMAEYRSLVWFGAAEVGFVDRTLVLGSLLTEQLGQEGASGAVSGGATVVASRSANLDLLASVSRRTPEEVPYWGGQTYVSLIGTFVPRIIWSGKPTKRLGQDFGHRYSYLSTYDMRTSLNLPWLVEFYANFGRWGVLAGTMLVGIIYGLLQQLVNRPGQSVERSALGLVLLVRLFNIESDFSLTFGGLILNIAALLVVTRWFWTWKARRVGLPSPRPSTGVVAPVPLSLIGPRARGGS